MPTWFIILWVITGGALIALTLQGGYMWCKEELEAWRLQRIIRKCEEDK